MDDRSRVGRAIVAAVVVEGPIVRSTRKGVVVTLREDALPTSGIVVGEDDERLGKVHAGGDELERGGAALLQVGVGE